VFSTVATVAALTAEVQVAEVGMQAAGVNMQAAMLLLLVPNTAVVELVAGA